MTEPALQSVDSKIGRTAWAEPALQSVYPKYSKIGRTAWAEPALQSVSSKIGRTACMTEPVLQWVVNVTFIKTIIHK